MVVIRDARPERGKLPFGNPQKCDHELCERFTDRARDFHHSISAACRSLLASPVLARPAVRKETESRSKKVGWSRHETLHVGFVPIVDCAVLIAAQELGLFARRGLAVELHKQVGWATVREKLLHGELDAVHAPASMGFAIRCGLGVVPQHCLTAFVLSLNGSAITLSRELWESGVRDAASLGALIRRERGTRTYQFGAVLDLSSQNQQLRGWLQSGGIDPDRDVRIQIVPSPVIHRGLTEGHLDGYCVAEPWNSIVTLAGGGWVVATSAELEPGLPEKILLVLEQFEAKRPFQHRAMVAALAEASLFCEQPENRPELVKMLAQPRYIGVENALLSNALIGPFDTGRGTRSIPDFICYHRHDANVPDLAKGRKVFDRVRQMDSARASKALRRDVIPKIFREDIYREALDQAGPPFPEATETGRLPPSTAPPGRSRLPALAH